VVTQLLEPNDRMYTTDVEPVPDWTWRGSPRGSNAPARGGDRAVAGPARRDTMTVQDNLRARVERPLAEHLDH
jgi:hypothetical protein